MNNAIVIKPKHDPYIKSSRMCGNCHTINLPLMDNPDADPNKPHLERVTYPEWLNSGYQNEVGTNSKAQTCQDCHMPTKYSNSAGTLNIPLIQQPTAFIEDNQYPQTGGRLPDEKIQVRFRKDRFTQAPNEPATQRLYYLTSNLQTKGTPIENWKFQITSASQTATAR